MVSRLQEQVGELRRLSELPDAQLFATCNGSQWSPCEHVDHSVKVLSSIVGRLLDPSAEPGRRLSLIGNLILLIGWIPRGRGRSPSRLRGMRATREELSAALDVLTSRLAQLDASHLDRRRGGIVPHPVFGGLTPPQAVRFAAIHTHHHLKIVADLLRRTRSS